MNLLLLILAWLLKNYLSPLLVVSGWLIAARKGYFSTYCRSVAVAIDKFGNVIGAPLWDLILRRKGGYPFGDWYDTISYAMAKNKRRGKLSTFGCFIEWILNLFEPEHLEKTISNYEKSGL